MVAVGCRWLASRGSARRSRRSMLGTGAPMSSRVALSTSHVRRTARHSSRLPTAQRTHGITVGLPRNCQRTWAAHGVTVGAQRERERAVERARVWEAVTEYGGAQWRLAVGAAREWECIVMSAPLGKLRVSCM